jgi:hypothetical protein
LPLAFKKINGLDAVFIQEQRSIYQYLSAKGDDYGWESLLFAGEIQE